ncbi:hypothetical protein [Pollutibacter soli]|uniref:hypothetical protein n=1 Tax=Pollutibacter soli TaxID=3034157 RepID=UPI0030135FA5
MEGVIKASTIRRELNIESRDDKKRIFVLINSLPRVEMICEKIGGNPGGVRWFFICPITKKRKHKLYFCQEEFIIPKYERKPWITGSPLDKLLRRLEVRMKAERQFGTKKFRTHYRGKPTKRFLKIQNGLDISMCDLINGRYDFLLKRKR